jgi:FkbM family methyltransferase
MTNARNRHPDNGATPLRLAVLTRIRHLSATMLTRYSAWRNQYRWLVAAGVTRRSAGIFSFRRRIPGLRRNRVDLVSGESLVTAADDRLLMLFDEIWVKESYLPAGWDSSAPPTVVDIGANVGVFSVWAARRLGAGRIVAVEPSPRTTAQLRVNLARNGVACATLLEVGVGGKEGHATLYTRGAPSLSTLYPRDVYGSRFEAEVRVRILTLDEVLRRTGVDHCDLLKLDCEGAEYEILFGTAEQTLARIGHVVGEYHVGMNAYGPSDLFKFLEGRGFAIRQFAPLDAEGGHFHASRRSTGTGG